MISRFIVFFFKLNKKKLFYRFGGSAVLLGERLSLENVSKILQDGSVCGALGLVYVSTHWCTRILY